MTRPTEGRSLITTLGRWIGASTALSLLIFAAAAALVLQVAEEEEEESGEAEAEEEAVAETEENPLDEAFAQVGMAMLVAAPLGIGLAVSAARWLARRTVARLAAVREVAARMTADNLADRLPVSAARDELDALAVTLNRLFARIDAGIALQRQFAADASHELRTPLAVLSGTLEVARRRARSSEEWETVVDRALDEVQHMTRLVEALLQLTRAGTVPRCDRVAVTELVNSVVTRFEHPAADAGVRLHVARVDRLFVDVDVELMTVALGNIVANALAHSPVGAVVLVEAYAAKDEVCVKVSDQGPGVPPHERERIFHPFVHGAALSADRSGTRVGLGLGLAITRRVVDGHAARVTVDDAAGGGAAFAVHLPRADAPTA